MYEKDNLPRHYQKPTMDFGKEFGNYERKQKDKQLYEDNSNKQITGKQLLEKWRKQK